MPVQDLVERIQEEIEANPALEVLEDRRALSLDNVSERDAEVESYFEASSDSGFRPSAPGGDEDSKRMFLEGAISRPETLQDHLLWQLRLQPIPERQKRLGEALISNLNADGFHIDEPEKLFKEGELPALRPLLTSTIEMIRGFEPVGCCTRDYRESLLVQAILSPDSPPEAASLIGEHLDLIERGKLQELARKLRIDEERLQCLLEFVKGLNPFPGRLYSSEETSYAIPDVMVKPKEGDFVIILNDEEIPVLGISPFMDRLGKAESRRGERGRANDAAAPGARRDKEAAEYARRNLRDARFFIQSIQQRNRTLLKVVRAVVEFQRGFFMQGPKHLVPLTLKDIAGEIGVHETTVSRIANKKYVQTEWGIFELRYFFTNSISGSGSSGSRFSKGGVKEVIREIIENETVPLSDQGISELLAQRGIKIARRTVAKYRNELKMDTSFSR